MKPLLAGVLLFLLAGCEAGPEPIRWGTDTCEQCRMILTDPAFGAAWATGVRTYKFDGVDELGAWLRAHPGTRGQPFVTDGSKGELFPAREAVYLRSPDIRSPMGAHVMSFKSQELASREARARGWRDVRQLSYDEALRDGAR